MNIKWLIAGDVWDAQLLKQFLFALPFIAAGMLFGDWLHSKVDQKRFTLLVYALLTAVALILGIKSVTGA